METNTKTTSNGIHNSKIHDNAAKLVFGDPVLCAQFLKEFTDIPFFQDIKPDDIEDISSRFLPLFQESRDSDVVKRIRIKNFEIYLIALIEHQSQTDFDMSFRLLRYMVFIWTDYAKTQEKLHPNITKSKDFLYPPILPIIYYEGTGEWTAALNFKERVFMSDIFEEYIPDFKYQVVPLSKFTRQDLIDKGNELSAIFILNKLKNSSEFKDLKDIPEEYWEHLAEHTPQQTLNLISMIFSAFLHKLNIPSEEINTLTDHITRRNFDMMFDTFEAYDVQETRRISREEGLQAGRIEGERTGRLEGERTGRLEGAQLYLIEQVIKRLSHHASASQIAEDLLEPIERIQPIFNLAMQQVPDCNAEQILEQLLSQHIDTRIN